MQRYFPNIYVTYLIQNSISRNVSRQENAHTQVRSCNDANISRQDSVNPSEDDTNMCPSSSVSFLPGGEDFNDRTGNSDNR